MEHSPRMVGGYPVWAGGSADVEIRFVGRGAARSRGEVLAAVEPGAPPVAWARQVHSTRLLEAAPGPCGEGDGLLGGPPGLALTVVTADCVPLLLAGQRHLAAVHAGWRGIAGGIVRAAIDRLGEPVAGAWIGPAIGACCYQVGEEVAAAVVDASTPEARRPRADGRPHLDLLRAITAQLAAAGVAAVEALAVCTRCRSDLLWSYRREGARAGRNHAFIWRRPPPTRA